MKGTSGIEAVNHLSVSIDMFLATALLLLGMHLCQLLLATLATASVFNAATQVDEEASPSGPGVGHLAIVTPR